MSYTTRSTCRVCGSLDLSPLFSLGNQYVSDFVDKDKVYSGPRCPIDLELCNVCSLVQAKHTPPQDFLYRKHYWYRSGVTKTMRDALLDVVTAAELTVDLAPGDIVLDIGSNDGTLLKSYNHPGIVRVGVEPADNLATEENYQGLILIHDFWGADKFFEAQIVRPEMQFLDGTVILEGMPKAAKVITACGMFYDLDDPNQFIADVAKVLARDGVFIAQLMCLKNMIEVCDVGNFAHEHLEYYSLRSLIYLLAAYGLVIFDIETNNVNGRSYRLFIKHYAASLGSLGASRRVVEAIVEEVGIEKNLDEFWQGVKRNRDECITFIKHQIAFGKKVWVYGASTKGNVILQFYGLNSELIPMAADRSPEKHGKYTAGTGIRIVSEEEFRLANPDYALVLPYTFREEIMEREKSWHDNGGKFIFPLPAFEVV